MSEKSVKPSRKADIIKVVLALLAVLMGTYIFVDPGNPTYQPNPTLVKKIDSLQAVNDKLTEINQGLDSTITSYENVIAELDYKVEDLLQYKKKLANYYADRSREIEDDTPSDIDTFFMDRYDYASDSE